MAFAEVGFPLPFSMLPLLRLADASREDLRVVDVLGSALVRLLLFLAELVLPLRRPLCSGLGSLTRVFDVDGEKDGRDGAWMLGGAKERRLGVDSDEEEDADDGRPR